MSNSPKPGAFLVVRMVVEEDLDKEFNLWYDEEHYPERMELPGFLDGKRMVSIDGRDKTYLAVYDLVDAAVLESPDYLKFGAPENWSEWTKSIAQRVVSIERRIYANITPAPRAEKGEE